MEIKKDENTNENQNEEVLLLEDGKKNQKMITISLKTAIAVLILILALLSVILYFVITSFITYKNFLSEESNYEEYGYINYNINTDNISYDEVKSEIENTIKSNQNNNIK